MEILRTRHRQRASRARLGLGWAIVCASALFAMSFATGCDDDGEDPVDIQFDGVDVQADGDQPKPKPAPKPTAEPTAKEPAKQPAAPTTAASSKLQQCCNALYSRAKSATTNADKALNQQAAENCSARMAAVRQGKLDAATALSQVRRTLLGSAPSSCQ